MIAPGRAWQCWVAGVALLVLALPVSAQQNLLQRLPKALRAAHAVREIATSKTPVSGLEIQRRAFGVVEQGSVGDDLNAILTKLRQSVPGSPDARVYVTPDPAMTAYTAPDATIFIAIGNLRSMETRDEVAALIAHEYAHVLLGHLEETELQENLRKAQGLSYTYLALKYDESSPLNTKAQRQQTLTQMLALNVIQIGILPRRTRGQEALADAKAMDLLVKANYNPAGMFDFLERMGIWEETQELARRKQEMELIDLKKELAKTQTLEEATVLVLMTPLMSVMQVAFAKVSQGMRKIARNHFGTERRSAKVRGYLDDTYPDMDRPESKDVPWRNRKQADALFAGVDAVDGMMRAMEAGNSAETIRLAAIAQATPAARIPYGRYALLRSQRELGAIDRATRGRMTQELQQPDALYASYFLILDILQKVAPPDEQMRMLETSRKALRDPPELMPYTISVYRHAGKDVDTANALARCRGHGDAGLTIACEARAKPDS